MHKDCEGMIGHDQRVCPACVTSTPAPEPVEVPADELAAAVAGMRSLIRTGAIPAITDDLRLILDEFARRATRIAELEDELSAEQDAYDELLAESGGVSSPPCGGGPPRGN